MVGIQRGLALRQVWVRVRVGVVLGGLGLGLRLLNGSRNFLRMVKVR
jgi:hypothetical protein